MVKGGLGRIGESLHCALDDGRFVEARIAPATFYDPDNAAQKAEAAGDLTEGVVPRTRLAVSSSTLLGKADTAADSYVGIVLDEWQNARLFTLLGSMVGNQQGSSSPSPEETLPNEPCTWSSVGSVRVCWVGPNRWLTLERSVDGREASLDFSMGLSADTHIVDTTGNFTVFSITGPSVKRLLQKSCAFDFHESVFSSNSCVRATVREDPGTYRGWSERRN